MHFFTELLRSIFFTEKDFSVKKTRFSKNKKIVRINLNKKTINQFLARIPTLLPYNLIEFILIMIRDLRVQMLRIYFHPSFNIIQSYNVVRFLNLQWNYVLVYF